MGFSEPRTCHPRAGRRGLLPITVVVPSLPDPNRSAELSTKKKRLAPSLEGRTERHCVRLLHPLEPQPPRLHRRPPPRRRSNNNCFPSLQDCCWSSPPLRRPPKPRTRPGAKRPGASPRGHFGAVGLLLPPDAAVRGNSTTMGTAALPWVWTKPNTELGGVGGQST